MASLEAFGQVLSMGRGYNIKFNKALFRGAILSELRLAAIMLPISLGIVGALLYCHARWQWPEWLVVPISILVLLGPGCGVFAVIRDTIEYRRIHKRCQRDGRQ